MKNTTIAAYCIHNGIANHLIISKDIYKILPCQVGDIIKANSYEKQYGKKLIGRNENGTNIYGTDETKVEFWLKSYEIAFRKGGFEFE